MRSNTMRRSVFIIVLAMIVFATSFVSAQAKDDFFFAPLSPKVMGQGDSFTAVAHGYESLFTNPAGFSRDGGSFTLLSTTASPYIPPNELETVIDGFEAIDNEELDSDETKALFDLISRNGFGGNASAGIGFVGRGLGLGLIVEGDMYGAVDPMGEALLSTEMNGHTTLAAIAGLGHTFNFGRTDLSIGGNLRFMHRVRTDTGGVTLDTLMDAGSFDVLAGNALAIDAGLIAERGSLALGLSMRDIASTSFSYERMDIEEYTEDTGETGEVLEEYAIPMSVNTGISYHPDWGRLSMLLDPTFHAEYRHVFYNDEKYEDRRSPSPWTRVHAGTEIRILRFLKLRGGINQGYPTIGAGVKLLFLDLNMVYFTRETGIVAGAKPNSGFAIEAALRF